MSRIEPIGSDRVREIAPVERVTRRLREDEQHGRKEQQQQRSGREPRPVPPRPDDGELPHVDVVV